AVRDDDSDVRAAAAACLGSLAEGDPKGAARIALELAGAEEASVRAAAATSLGNIALAEGGADPARAAGAPRGRDTLLGPLLKLLSDPDRPVRLAAAEAVAALGAPHGSASKKTDDLERAL